MSEEKITPQQIEKWRARWDSKENVINELIRILKGDGPVYFEDTAKAERRLKQANDFLKGKIAGYEEIKTKYFRYGIEVYSPVSYTHLTLPTILRV